MPPPATLSTADTGSASSRNSSTAPDEDPSAPCQALHYILPADSWAKLGDGVQSHHLPDPMCLIPGADPWSLFVSKTHKDLLIQILLSFFEQHSHEGMSRLPLHTSSDEGLTASSCNPPCLELVLLVRNHSQICLLISSPYGPCFPPGFCHSMVCLFLVFWRFIEFIFLARWLWGHALAYTFLNHLGHVQANFTVGTKTRAGSYLSTDINLF